MPSASRRHLSGQAGVRALSNLVQQCSSARAWGTASWAAFVAIAIALAIGAPLSVVEAQATSVPSGADNVDLPIPSGVTAQPANNFRAIRAGETAKLPLRPDLGVAFPGSALGAEPSAVFAPLPPAKRANWLAPVASALVPGSGQALLGQQRSIAYLVAEGFLVIRAVRARRDANDARAQYRSIAADVARLPFGTDRPVGTWDYYETLEHYPASGEYDLAVGGKFTPEPDASTYNGRVWYQARSTYWASPDDPPTESSAEYLRALAFYKERAVSGSFRWSWTDQQLAQEAYIQTIRESNRSKQNLVSAVGLVAANHLVSLVDAYVTVRLRRYGGAGLVGASLKTEFSPGASSMGGAGVRALSGEAGGAAPLGFMARFHVTLPIPGRR